MTIDTSKAAATPSIDAEELSQRTAWLGDLRSSLAVCRKSEHTNASLCQRTEVVKVVWACSPDVRLTVDTTRAWSVADVGALHMDPNHCVLGELGP